MAQETEPTIAELAEAQAKLDVLNADADLNLKLERPPHLDLDGCWDMVTSLMRENGRLRSIAHGVKDFADRCDEITAEDPGGVMRCDLIAQKLHRAILGRWDVRYATNDELLAATSGREG